MLEVVLPLTVRDLTAADLPSCAWSGGPMHMAAIAGALDRARRGEVEYLAVCPPSGLPVALGGIDYVKIPGAGVLWQLAVHGALQSCGIGTILIGAAELRIRAAACTGPSWAWRRTIHAPARCTNGSATSLMAARPIHGMRMPRTGRSSAMRPYARSCARNWASFWVPRAAGGRGRTRATGVRRACKSVRVGEV